MKYNREKVRLGFVYLGRGWQAVGLVANRTLLIWHIVAHGCFFEWCFAFDLIFHVVGLPIDVANGAFVVAFLLLKYIDEVFKRGN